MAFYWCHSCDMSIALPTPPTPNSLLCPNCHFDSLEQLHNTDNNNDNSEPTPAPKSSIDSLSEVVIKIDDVDVMCPICKDPFVLDSVAKVMPCDHRFHSHCIVPWLEINNSCPVCRFKLPVVVEEVSVVVEEGSSGFVPLDDEPLELVPFMEQMYIGRREQREFMAEQRQFMVEQRAFAAVQRQFMAQQRQFQADTRARWAREDAMELGD